MNQRAKIATVALGCITSLACLAGWSQSVNAQSVTNGGFRHSGLMCVDAWSRNMDLLKSSGSSYNNSSTPQTVVCPVIDPHWGRGWFDPVTVGIEVLDSRDDDKVTCTLYYRGAEGNSGHVSATKSTGESFVGYESFLLNTDGEGLWNGLWRPTANVYIACKLPRRSAVTMYTVESE